MCINKETRKAIGTQTSLIFLNPLATCTQTHDSSRAIRIWNNNGKKTNFDE